MHDWSRIRDGMTVWSADGEKLGKVIRCDASGIYIEKGIFFPKDYVARLADVAAVDEDDVRLTTTKDMLQRVDLSEGAGAEEVRVPVREEQLQATKRVSQAGEVVVKKDVKTEHRTIDVPVTREEVRVERRAVDRPAAGADVGAFREETVRVPVREEEVEIHKRPVVREEVRVTKTPHVEHRTASETVRREEVDVDENGVPRRRFGDDDLKKT